MLSSNAYFKSEKAAYSLIDRYNITKAPVDIYSIVKEQGIEVLEYNLGEDASGVLVIEKGKGTIGLNPHDSPVRKRFTLAHELGHYVLHNHTKSNEIFVDNYFLMKFRKNNSYSSKEYKHEQEANAFAAAILMPEKFIETELASEDLKSYNESEIIANLASKFEVSVAAMSYRLGNLNIF